MNIGGGEREGIEWVEGRRDRGVYLGFGGLVMKKGIRMGLEDRILECDVR